MKVLSIKQPFASLICKNIKKIETRSWKTKYRGELYIHSSLTKSKSFNAREAEALLDGNLQFGTILCKCNLIDCIYMDDNFINNIKQNNSIEYRCGKYEVGRYAWILDNIEIIKPIKVKGKLGIW